MLNNIHPAREREQANRAHSRRAEVGSSAPAVSPIHSSMGQVRWDEMHVILAEFPWNLRFCLQQLPCDTLWDESLHLSSAFSSTNISNSPIEFRDRIITELFTALADCCLLVNYFVFPKIYVGKREALKMYKLNNVIRSKRNTAEIAQVGWRCKDFAVNNCSYLSHFFFQKQISWPPRIRRLFGWIQIKKHPALCVLTLIRNQLTMLGHPEFAHCRRRQLILHFVNPCRWHQERVTPSCVADICKCCQERFHCDFLPLIFFFFSLLYAALGLYA